MSAHGSPLAAIRPGTVSIVSRSGRTVSSSSHANPVDTGA